MTHDEAIEQMARERECTFEEVSRMICAIDNCPMSQCVEFRKLLATPSPELVLSAHAQFPAFSAAAEEQGANPKTLMGNLKVRNFSVIPMTALIHEGRAMEYGAFHAPRKDGSKGYGPFNWRDQNIEYLTYLEAAMRHLMSAADREDIDPDTGELKVLHLALARATIGILIDAIEHNTVIDNRPITARGRVAQLLRELRKTA